MIVGIGELLWDIFPDGRKVAGGAPFNFAFHCHQLGHEAVIVSRVGDDDLGRELREDVKRLGLSDEYIQTDREHPTGTVRVTVDTSGQPSYEIVENVAWDFIAWTSELADLSNRASVLCFGTLAQRQPTTESTVLSMMKAATGALQVFDVNIRGVLTWQTQRLGVELAKRVHWYKVNVDELFQLLNGPYQTMEIDEIPSKKESWIRLLFETGIDLKKLGILTRGSKSTAITDWQQTIWVPSIPANVVDTVGAGDAFTAAMVCLHLEGKPLRECARFANRYAARVCEHRGATPRIDRREIESLAALD